VPDRAKRTEIAVGRTFQRKEKEEEHVMEIEEEEEAMAKDSLKIERVDKQSGTVSDREGERSRNSRKWLETSEESERVREDVS
jgi:hypothetical protein